MTDGTHEDEQNRVAADCPNELIVSNLHDGDVPAGESCFASDECTFKHYACNGHGCPVADGRTRDEPFSCGQARAFAFIGC